MTFRRQTRMGPRILAFIALVLVVLAVGKVILERRASTVSGTVYDEYTGAPLAGAVVRWDTLETRTNAAGRFTLIGVNTALRDKPIALSADEHASLDMPSNQDEAKLYLRPDTISGTVSDKAGKPIPGTRVVSGTVSAEADAQGEFYLKGVSQDPNIRVAAPGYRVVTLQPGRQQRVEVRLEPLVVRGLYIGFGTMALPERREAAIREAERFGLNAVVLDIKSDRGLVNSELATPLSEGIGASVKQSYDLAATLRDLKARGFYTIARLVVFKDRFLGLAHPEIAVREDGELYLDCEDQHWLDPFSEKAWDYNLDLAQNAARMGFDEIHFDYLRFPSDCVQGSLTYSQEVTSESQRAAIEGFLERAHQRLRPLGVSLSAAVFGLTTVQDDIGIGQFIGDIARHVDYVSPMVYPSTWRSGAFDSEYPAAEPYRIVKLSVGSAVERLKDTGAKVRPWLQAFNDYKARQLPYGWPEIETQIKAAQEAGALGWLLWNPAADYSLGSPSP